MPSSKKATTIQGHDDSNLVGVLWALAGVGLFALIYVSGKLSETNASALQIMWLRYVGGFTTMAILLAKRRNIAQNISTTQPLMHVCRAAAGSFGGAAAVYAAANMPVASASAIGLLDGLFIVILGLIILREYVSVRQWIATLVSLSGAVVVVASQGAFSSWDVGFTVPALIALAGALLIAIESILIKTLVRGEAAFTVLFYVNLFGSFILAWPAFATWQTVPPHWLFAFLMLGPISLVAQYCNINAFRRADASIIGPIRYTWVIYGAAIGVLFFNEPVTLAMGVGIALILFGGGWLATLRSRRD